MIASVILERNRVIRSIDPVASDGANRTAMVRDIDVIDGLAMPIVDDEVTPARWNLRFDAQVIDFEMKAE